MRLSSSSSSYSFSSFSSSSSSLLVLSAIQEWCGGSEEDIKTFSFLESKDLVFYGNIIQIKIKAKCVHISFTLSTTATQKYSQANKSFVSEMNK
jgi:hypothetical protein